MPSEIAVPFRLDTNGRVVTTEDPDAQVRLHVLALLNTHPSERVMVPGYGTDVTSMVFEDTDGDDVAAQTSILVRDAFSKHEPGVDLVKTEPNYSESRDNLALVDVEYRRLDAPDSGELVNANVAIIGSNGVVREVVRS